jgi:type IV pilus assembly protein PilM
MTKLHVDINRSIAYYRTTLNGAPPKRVFLTGGSSQLPYLDLFIGDKLSLPVAYFNPLRNVNLGPKLNTTFLQQNSCFTAELVGLALRATGSCPAEVTLDAPTLAARAAKKRKQPYYFASLFAWVLLVACMGVWYWQQIAVAQGKATAVGDNADSLKGQAPKVIKLSGDVDARNSLYETTRRLGDQRDAWARVLQALNDKIPTGVWITVLVPASNPTGDTPRGAVPTPSSEVNMLDISGLYHSYDRTETISPDRLRDFINALGDSPLFDIDKSNMNGTLTSLETKESTPNSFALRFTMHLKLKTPIRLAPETK